MALMKQAYAQHKSMQTGQDPDEGLTQEDEQGAKSASQGKRPAKRQKKK